MPTAPLRAGSSGGDNFFAGNETAWILLFVGIGVLGLLLSCFCCSKKAIQASRGNAFMERVRHARAQSEAAQVHEQSKPAPWAVVHDREHVEVISVQITAVPGADGSAHHESAAPVRVVKAGGGSNNNSLREGVDLNAMRQQYDPQVTAASAGAAVPAEAPAVVAADSALLAALPAATNGHDHSQQQQQQAVGHESSLQQQAQPHSEPLRSAMATEHGHHEHLHVSFDNAPTFH